MPCSIEQLIAGMVYQFQNSPKLIGWANSTSPIIDVTDTVRKVYPDVEAARLTIYGDPKRVRIIYKSTTRPPAQTPDQIVRNWMRGIEIERQYCKSDNMHYLVQYPAKLEIKKVGQADKMLMILLAAAIAVSAMSALKR